MVWLQSSAAFIWSGIIVKADGASAVVNTNVEDQMLLISDLRCVSDQSTPTMAQDVCSRYSLTVTRRLRGGVCTRAVKKRRPSAVVFTVISP